MIQKYNPAYVDRGGYISHIAKDANGEYVKYDDHVKEAEDSETVIGNLNVKIIALEKELSRYRKAIEAGRELAEWLRKGFHE